MSTTDPRRTPSLFAVRTGSEPPEHAALAVAHGELRTGTVVGRGYRIDGVLGRGGMGVVYVAEELSTGRAVALKFVTWGAEAERADRESRFMSEVRNACAVSHRHVIDVLDAGFHAGEPYLVMEYLVGESLDQRLQRTGALSPEAALAVLLPIADALAALHARGILHRDIKPSNIFLAEVGDTVVPKLLDFGVSRALGDPRSTHTGAVFGTPLYMAPEHAAGSGATPASEVWSLAVVLYECLSGAAPYQSLEPKALATLVLAGSVLPLGARFPHLPPRLCAVIGGGLVRDEGLRCSDMLAFAEALAAAAVADEVPLSFDGWVRAHTPRHGPVPTPTAAGAQPSERSIPTLRVRRAPRRPWIVPTGVAAAALLTALVVGVRAGRVALGAEASVVRAEPAAPEVAQGGQLPAAADARTPSAAPLAGPDQARPPEPRARSKPGPSAPRAPVGTPKRNPQPAPRASRGSAAAPSTAAPSAAAAASAAAASAAAARAAAAPSAAGAPRSGWALETHWE